MARIDRQTIERIMDAADIVDVVGDYVELRRRGANYMGLCPFHNERTPSFSVSKAKGICKCFSCGKGGNVVNFLMEIEQISYGEAMRRLARRYGIEIKEEEESEEELQRRRERDALFAVMEFAAGFYRDCFESADGSAVRDIASDLGIDMPTARLFSLGASPGDPALLMQEARKAGYSDAQLRVCGLEAGLPAGALVVALSNHYGKCVGLRALGPDGEPLGPDVGPAMLLRPAEMLFGFHIARREIAKAQEAVVASCPVDVMLLASAGIATAVAPLVHGGWQSSVVPQLRRMASEVTVLLPRPLKWKGYETMRAASAMLEAGMRVWVVSFPDAADCRRFAATHSSMEIAAAVGSDARIDMLMFKLANLRKVTADERFRSYTEYMTDDLLLTIAAVADPISREVYIEECAARLSITPDRLRRMIADAKRIKPDGE